MLYTYYISLKKTVNAKKLVFGKLKDSRVVSKVTDLDYIINEQASWAEKVGWG
jgi:hypothetical protein